MYKIAINWDFGGWDLSTNYEIKDFLISKGLNKKLIEEIELGFHKHRCNPILIEALEKYPQEDIEFIQVPKKHGYIIVNYDGAETVITSDPDNFIFFKE